MEVASICGVALTIVYLKTLYHKKPTYSLCSIFVLGLLLLSHIFDNPYNVIEILTSKIFIMVLRLNFIFFFVNKVHLWQLVFFLLFVGVRLNCFDV